MAPAELLPGLPYPLGAKATAEGVNFAVFSAHARSIELCIFDSRGRDLLWAAPLPARSADVWHGFLPNAKAGLVYGLRALGPYAPNVGHRFAENRILLDPYAREIVGKFVWHTESSAPLKARVVAAEPPPEKRPKISLADQTRVIYEMHVKGFTQQLAGVDADLRGSYAGLAHPAALGHLSRLGVTTVSLLPVQHSLSEKALRERGLVNYWGYNTLGFFCPDPRFASARVRALGDPHHDADAARAIRDEFRHMVSALHQANIEVVLDMVLNHTCESDHDGPTLSWRGLDNASWYRLDQDWPDRYINDSGCGNTLDTRHPRVLQFVMDVLRFWVEEMGVDGFRFDLAPILARGDHGFDRRHAFFHALSQDPVLSSIIVIAEPWDVGVGGYQLGAFPDGWLEWNDRFRDDMRRFWLCGHVTRGEFARRLCASADIFQQRYRLPAESVNYLTSHDGFTLRDLVTYAERHNELNGEGNRDGHTSNYSCNFGIEGETQHLEIVVARQRMQRALLATCLLAQGTPMLSAGSELGHTQRGNNNAYCQDNELGWLDWAQADDALIDFTRHVISLRQQYQPFLNRWYQGARGEIGEHDLDWLAADGSRLEGEAWQRSEDRCLGALINESGSGAVLLMLVNGESSRQMFSLPTGFWQLLLDSTEERGLPSNAHALGIKPQQHRINLPGHAVILLRSVAVELLS
jgi:glycogen debranching enzyme GlgX